MKKKWAPKHKLPQKIEQYIFTRAEGAELRFGLFFLVLVFSVSHLSRTWYMLHDLHSTKQDSRQDFSMRKHV